ncbi:uncharacterized protein EDB93DRAFT_513396 [Suillus bovinus]|uniref:uncharacterized protein n=1 Tax=Suillus bovinus TaxID=48563 RepID=UPI001B886706|nr:uncharacterized protein EDB93DRAFT_513396 [Suillus bovinus]KAG2145310.1 hypothetical protein EDB93DRAFT_513396 [Suillus bovinus]
MEVLLVLAWHVFMHAYSPATLILVDDTLLRTPRLLETHLLVAMIGLATNRRILQSKIQFPGTPPGCQPMRLMAFCNGILPGKLVQHIKPPI